MGCGMIVGVPVTRLRVSSHDDSSVNLTCIHRGETQGGIGHAEVAHNSCIYECINMNQGSTIVPKNDHTIAGVYQLGGILAESGIEV